MLQRGAVRLIQRRLASTPAVAVVGPRQSGKTTLARSLGGQYFDLEQEIDQLALDLAWAEVTHSDELTIIDEAQCWPDLFSKLRGTIDAERQRMGRFLLLGSVAPALMRQVSESLAGRLALVELAPLAANELPADHLDRLWRYGGYPDGGVLADDGAPFPRWQRDYLSLLSQRDLPAWGLPAKPQITDRLLRMLAATHGQQWNASQIGKSLGLSHPTVNSYTDFLIGAFLIRRLQPWHGNVGKRLSKTPRMYWRDSGLLHALQLISDRRDLLSRPWVGASWEGFVIEQVCSTLNQLGTAYEPYFFRTSDGSEIDLVLDFGHSSWAIEIKLTSLPSSHDLAKLNKTADLVAAERRFLVSQTRRSIVTERQSSCDLSSLLAELTAASKARPHPRSD